MKLLGLKPKKPPPMPKPATRDDATAAADRDRELAMRMGSRADQVTGQTGAEAGKGAATLLG